MRWGAQAAASDTPSAQAVRIVSSSLPNAGFAEAVNVYARLFLLTRSRFRGSMWSLEGRKEPHMKAYALIYYDGIT